MVNVRFAWHTPLAHFPIYIEHNSHNDPEKSFRYDLGLRRLRLLTRIAEPFAFGPHWRARAQGEQVYAFLAPISDESRSADIPDSAKFEYLADSIVDIIKVTLFSYIWFDSLADAKFYGEKKNMTRVGGWNEQN